MDEMAAGYDISGSWSASSGNKATIGAVSFGPVTVGTSSTASKAVWVLGILGAVLLFLFWRKR